MQTASPANPVGTTPGGPAPGTVHNPFSDNGSASDPALTTTGGGVTTPPDATNGIPQPGGNNGAPQPGGNNGAPQPSGNNGAPQPGANNGAPQPGANNGAPQPGANNGAPPPGANNGAPQPGANNGAPQPGANNGAPQPGANNGAPQPGANNGAPQPGANNGAPQPGANNGSPPPGANNNTTQPDANNNAPQQPLQGNAHYAHPTSLKDSPAGTFDRPTPQQMRNLNFLKDNATKPNSANKNDVVEFYRNFRLDDQTLARLDEIANDIAALVFNDPKVLSATTRWPNLSTAEREQFLKDINATLENYFGLSVDLDIFHQPAINGQIRGGYYDGGTNTLSMNLHPDAARSPANVISVLVHEWIHKVEVERTRHLSPFSVIAAVEAGEISYTDGVLHMMMYEGNNLTAGDIDFADYQLNPHEQAAFTGQHMLDLLAAQYNLGVEGGVLAPDHPLAQRMAQSSIA